MLDSVTRPARRCSSRPRLKGHMIDAGWTSQKLFDARDLLCEDGKHKSPSRLPALFCSAATRSGH